nr:MAG TPA: hypothetical protein [Caudoviricetes sp.]
MLRFNRNGEIKPPKKAPGCNQVLNGKIEE